LKMAYLSKALSKNFDRYSWLYQIDTRTHWEDLVNEIRTLSHNDWFLPYDLKTLDRQMSHKEMLVVLDELVSYALEVSTGSSDRFDVAANLTAGFRQMYITVPTDQGSMRIKQEAGLPSGIQWTTYFGSLWNMAMLTMAHGTVPVPFLIVKGDDSVLAGPKWLCLFEKVALDALGIVASDGKFGITKFPEFLRRAVLPDTVVGYVARSISGLTQRKPWNPEPIGPYSRWANSIEQAVLIWRRSGIDLTPGVGSVIRSHIGIWADVPPARGGVGIDPSRLSKIPKLRLESERPSATSPIPPENVEVRTSVYLNYDPTLTIQQRETISRNQLAQAIDADEIPGLATAQVNAIREAQARTTFEAIRHGDRNPMLFGAAPWLNGVAAVLATISRVARKFTIASWLTTHHPTLFWHLRAFEKKFHVSRGLAIKWFSGEAPTGTVSLSSPMMAHEIKHAAALQLRTGHGDPAFLVAWAATVREVAHHVRPKMLRYFAF
jgi:hypothetical protein